MPKYRFEIVGLAFDRFTWRLVELRGKRRRVLARDDQTYSTLEKVEAAIVAFKANVEVAQVVNTTLPDETPFPLPPTRFEFVDGVVPLVVEGSPEEDEEYAEGLPEPARQEPERREVVQPEPTRQEQLTKPAGRSRQPVGASASTTQKGTTRSGGRRQKRK